ncbi:MAG: lamin tail domain-containing protein, partial [Candidatus Aegiribacteria sp.]|nr:lamin tail domain-containing protein [Candidatus Aegiribacteria sp.]
SMTLSEWEFEPGGNSDSVKVSIEYAQAVDYIMLIDWSDNENSSTWSMNQDDPSGCCWSRTISFPSYRTHIKFSVIAGSQDEGGVCYTPFYYPLYAPPTSFSPRRVCAPTARRSIYSFYPEVFEVLAPVRYTVFLWSLPVINTSNTPQDVSFCGFQAGNPPARLFASKQTVIEPGDTLYLTNNSELLSDMMPYNTVLGNLALTSPSNTEFILMYPSWQTALTVTVKEEVNCNESSSSVILSEICFDGDSGDWIELFNTSLFRADISGYILIDGQNNEITLPPNTMINPGSFLVVCEDEQSFRSVNGYNIEVIEGMNFGLNNEKDGVTLLESDRLIFSVMYDAVSWPLEDNHVLSLSSPELPLSNSLSWQAIELPGTPGRSNPGWPDIILKPFIETLWPNPVSTSFNLNYIVPSVPAELLLYDISGRLVLQPQSITGLEGSLSCSLPPSLTPGIYFAVIRSCGTSASRKFVLLP